MLGSTPAKKATFSPRQFIGLFTILLFGLLLNNFGTATGAPNPQPTEPDFIPPQEKKESNSQYWDEEDLLTTDGGRLQQIDGSGGGGHGHRHGAAFGFPAPSKGDQPLLVLLVDFPDRPGLFTGDAWSDRFFGPGGFADYHREVSYNQLRYSGDIIGLSNGQPVINAREIAYIELPNPIKYYADGNRGFTVTPGQFPQNNGGVVYHALQALDKTGFDFEPYADSESDKVENLIIIYAGSSYAFTNDPDNSLQATGYRLTWAGLGGPFVSRDGYRFDNYTFCPDQAGNLSGELAFIGVCAHEMAIRSACRISTITRLRQPATAISTSWRTAPTAIIWEKSRFTMGGFQSSL